MNEPCVIQVNNDEGWDDFVMAHDSATNYHLLKWRGVVSETFSHEARYLSCRGADEKIRGILPLILIRSRFFGTFLVSMPFFNYGGLVCDDADAGRALLEESDRIMRSSGASYVELRHVRDAGHGLLSKKHKATFILDLERTDEAQWKAFDPKLRNQIRKAERSGLAFETGSLELLDRFYRIFATNMRDLGTPVYPKSFFASIIKRSSGTSNICIVSGRNGPVAGGVTSSFRQTLELPWAGSLRSARHLCPNDMLYWGVIRYAIANGYRSFDFGRSTIDSGPYRFKKQWGARAEQLWWQYRLIEGRDIPDLSPHNPAFGQAVRIWQHLPVWLTRLVGPKIVRYLP